jgi:cbb3-type cytochrome oxidase subunit 3
MTRFRSVLVAPVVALLVLTAGAAHAAVGLGSEGSVPSEVAGYVKDGSLVAQLDDVYGVNAEGDGIDFDDTTEPGVIERVHVWSDELRAGESTEHPVDIINEWVVPITIDESPVGLATIWINPATVAPELASFEADAELATALSKVEKGSSLVHDAQSSAWLALAADGTLTPLVPGSTGLSTPVPIDDVAVLPAPSDGAPPSDSSAGAGFAIAVMVFLLVVIVVVLVAPSVRSRNRADADEDAGFDFDDEPVPDVVPEVEPEVEPAAAPAKRPKTPRTAPPPEDG